MIYSIIELSMKFQSLDTDQQEQVSKEITDNIHIYGIIGSQLPLIQYIKGGESAVPVDQHGPIITAYKKWADKQK